MTDFLAEDYRFTLDLLRRYASGPGQDTAMFRAVCSNNLNIILAALAHAEAVAPRDTEDITMSDISRVVMDALRKQLTELEMDAILIRGRTEQLRSTIDWLEHGTRPKGRPRKSSNDDLAVIETLHRVYGPETEPGEAA